VERKKALNIILSQSRQQDREDAEVILVLLCDDWTQRMLWFAVSYETCIVCFLEANTLKEIDSLLILYVISTNVHAFLCLSVHLRELVT